MTDELVWRVQDGFTPMSSISRMPGMLGSAGSMDRRVYTHGLASVAASESSDHVQAAQGSEGECSSRQGERCMTLCHPASEVTQHRSCCALWLQVVTNPLRFDRKEVDPHFSMEKCQSIFSQVLQSPQLIYFLSKEEKQYV